MSGVLKKIFILSKHGTKANIRSTKMANNRHAYNRDVLQSYWTSANSGRLMTLLDLSPADFRRFLAVFVDRRLLGNKCCLSTGQVANGIRLTKRCNALSSRSDAIRGLPDFGKSFTLLVCVCFLTSRPSEISGT
jgi:hypothetical protein